MYEHAGGCTHHHELSQNLWKIDPYGNDHAIQVSKNIEELKRSIIYDNDTDGDGSDDYCEIQSMPETNVRKRVRVDSDASPKTEPFSEGNVKRLLLNSRLFASAVRQIREQ